MQTTDDEVRYRIEAHRAAFATLAMVVNEFAPGTFAALIDALAALEAGARSMNEPSALIDEVREIRAGLQSMADDLPPPRSTHSLPADSAS